MTRPITAAPVQNIHARGLATTDARQTAENERVAAKRGNPDERVRYVKQVNGKSGRDQNRNESQAYGHYPFRSAEDQHRQGQDEIGLLLEGNCPKVRGERNWRKALHRCDNVVEKVMCVSHQPSDFAAEIFPAANAARLMIVTKEK